MKKIADLEVTLVELPAEKRESAFEKYQIIFPYLEDRTSLAEIARHHKLNERTLRRWVRRYQASGLAGLSHKQRSDRGKHVVSKELRLLIEGLALRPPFPSSAAIHRQVLKVAQQQGWKAPSYRTIHNIVCDIDLATRTLAQEGDKAYQARFELLYRREAVQANDIWQSDHCRLDIWLRDEHNQPRQPWLTVILDDYSRAVAGYFLSFESPNSVHTALALHQAIWRKGDGRWPVCGIPLVFYTDNGSDFTSNHMKQVSADIEMTLVFSTPGQPRGRGRIERFFRSVNQLFLCELPGYLNAKAATMTLTEFGNLFHIFLLENYHQRVHSAIGMTPLHRWSSGGFLPRMPETVQQLDLLLLTVPRSRRIQRDGIHFQGLCYMDLNLSAYIGEDVIIRYDPRDMAEIRVYHNHQFLCRAICQELAGETISLKDIIKARRHTKKEVRESIQHRQALVDALLHARRMEVPPTDEEVTTSPHPQTRLKRYIHE